MKIELYMPCPVCMAHGNNSTKQYWRHSLPCGGVLALNEKAWVECQGCGKTAKLIDMNLICEEQIHTYKIASVEGFAQAIATSSHFVNEMGITWLLSVMVNL